MFIIMNILQIFVGEFYVSHILPLAAAIPALLIQTRQITIFHDSEPGHDNGLWLILLLLIHIVVADVVVADILKGF